MRKAPWHTATHTRSYTHTQTKNATTLSTATSNTSRPTYPLTLNLQLLLRRCGVAVQVLEALLAGGNAGLACSGGHLGCKRAARGRRDLGLTALRPQLRGVLIQTVRRLERLLSTTVVTHERSERYNG